ncbi:hypothetical protein RRG08_010918 [Elysia crispata]|uniref:Uncharacterized protein n=1 Tax=Elysia crispata TaxID=231223 RepID=A0AAE1DPR6_9GAST|nr:hypothetical protein RRG08_010918 [Elysia crispata]
MMSWSERPPGSYRTWQDLNLRLLPHDAHQRLAGKIIKIPRHQDFRLGADRTEPQYITHSSQPPNPLVPIPLYPALSVCCDSCGRDEGLSSTATLNSTVVTMIKELRFMLILWVAPESLVGQSQVGESQLADWESSEEGRMTTRTGQQLIPLAAEDSPVRRPLCVAGDYPG